MRNYWFEKAPNNSIKDVVEFLEENPFQTETDIQENVWEYYRNSSIRSNKKYADLLRRGLLSRKVARIEAKVKGSKSRFFYYIPK